MNTADTVCARCQRRGASCITQEYDDADVGRTIDIRQDGEGGLPRVHPFVEQISDGANHLPSRAEQFVIEPRGMITAREWNMVQAELPRPMSHSIFPSSASLPSLQVFDTILVRTLPPLMSYPILTEILA